MAVGTPIQQTVWQGGCAVNMAQVYGVNGSAITQSVVASITYRLFKADGTTVTDTTPLTVASQVYNTMQTDARWTFDATGYNFSHTITHLELSDPNETYVAEYYATSTTGQVYVIGRFELHTNEMLSASADASTYPRMSMWNVTPEIPTPTPTTFAQIWAEQQARVGAWGILSDANTLALWVDSYHTTAMALFTTEKLFVQVDTADWVGGAALTLQQMTTQLQTLLTTYPGKIWGINFGCELNEILGADAGSKRPWLTTLHNQVKGYAAANNVDIQTCVSFNLNTARTAGNVTTLTQNASAIVDCVGITDYPSYNAETTLPNLAQSRYDAVRTYTTKPIIMAEFGYGNANGGTVPLQEQAYALELAHRYMVAVGNCPLFVYAMPYNIIAGGGWETIWAGFTTMGLSTGTIASPTRLPAYNEWTRLKNLNPGSSNS